MEPARGAAALEAIEKMLAMRFDVRDASAIEQRELREAPLRRGRTHELAYERRALRARGFVKRVSLGHGPLTCARWEGYGRLSIKQLRSRARGRS